jgi:hypothetical protein
MKSAYFVPTNRKIERCVNSYIKEIVYAKENYSLDIPFIVVETNNDDFVKENHKVLENLKKQYPDIEIIHMTTDIQKKYFDKLFEGIESGVEIAKIFLNTEANYGTTMNKISLLTCSLGAESFHRRDSDTCLIFDEMSDVRKVYPIEYELKYLGKKIKELMGKGITIPDEVNIDKEITVVGGNYFGEWNLDVKDFARKSFEIIYKLYELLGFEKDSIKEICDEAFRFDVKFEDRDKLTLVTSVNDGLNPDCGNVAVYKLFEYLPNVPGKNTLAADYFMFDTATALGLPSLHHTRAVFHEYHSERFEFERKNRYWYGVAKFADYFNNYGTIYNENIMDEFSSEEKLISEPIMNMLKESISEFENLSKNERIDRIKQIASQVLIPFDKSYGKIGENLFENAEGYINESNDDYNKHIMLLENWNSIISKAKTIDIRKFIGGINE